MPADMVFVSVYNSFQITTWIPFAMKPSITICVLLMLNLCISKISYADSTLVESNAKADFFNQLKSLCGSIFTGQSSFPQDPDDSFFGKTLVASISDCTENEIRIPFAVGNDHSRTWILTFENQQLLFKHDHRHADGSPDEITDYGGWANNAGTANRQFFPADEHTAELIPAAATNVWMMEIDIERGILVYYLERHQQPRFRGELNHLKQ